MFLTTRALLELTDHGPAVLELIDACSAHQPQLYRELLSRCPIDAGLLGPEKIAMAISNHGRLHRHEPGWEWYDGWCERHDEAAFVKAVIDYCAETFAASLPPLRRRA